VLELKGLVNGKPQYCFMLQSKVLEPTGDDAAAAALQRVIEGFCVQLLAPGLDGRLPFVGRLLHLIKVCSSVFKPRAGAPLLRV